MKLLLKGKPLADVKTLGELGLKEGEEATVTAMLMGSAAASSDVEMKEAPAKTKALAEDAFWKELGAFLEKRLGGADIEEDPKEVLKAFRGAWKA